MFFKNPWRLDLRTDPDSALGMTVIPQKGSASAGITPLPILLNQQLDSFIERKTADLESQFLTELQTRIFLKRPPDEWFGIYLAIFVFFTALEEDTWNLETWSCGVKSAEISVSPSTLVTTTVLTVTSLPSLLSNGLYKSPQRPSLIEICISSMFSQRTSGVFRRAIYPLSPQRRRK